MEEHVYPKRCVGGPCLLAIVALACNACVTVRPEQRAVMADPVMQYEGERGDRRALDHALENREGSYGGGSVRGGGCGCN